MPSGTEPAKLMTSDWTVSSSVRSAPAMRVRRAVEDELDVHGEFL